jgi:hypothetical protein
MAYEFNGTSDYIEATAAVVTAVPLTMACWVNPDNTTANHSSLAVSASTGLERWLLQLAGGISGDPIRAFAQGGGSLAAAESASAFTANTWQHAAARFSANNNRRAYRNGVGGTANTTSITPTGVNRTNIGCNFGSGSRGGFHDGEIAEVGIWNVALDDAEIAALANGFRCSLIRPSNLVFYAPIIREVDDYARGVSLTTSGAVVSVNPRRIA